MQVLWVGFIYVCTLSSLIVRFAINIISSHLFKILYHIAICFKRLIDLTKISPLEANKPRPNGVTKWLPSLLTCFFYLNSIRTDKKADPIYLSVATFIFKQIKSSHLF